MKKSFLKQCQYVLVFIFLLTATGVHAYLPSDPLYDQQGYLDSINIKKAWDIAKGNGSIVAVLDSGVDINHPDLRFNIWKNPDEIAGDGIDNDHNGYIDDVNGWDFVDSDGDASPELDDGYSDGAVSHGTAISGVIAAVGNNGIGMTGVAFNAKIMPLRVLKGNGEGFVDDLAAAIEYAVNKGADVINLSLVGDTSSQLLDEAIARAYQNGVLVVAAAGNTAIGVGGRDLDEDYYYPACYGVNGTNTVIAVSSLNEDGQKSAFSNYGADCVDISALGEGIHTLAYYDPDHGFDNPYSYNWAGTSFSTALVSGVVALIKSKNQLMSSDQVMSALFGGSIDVDDKNFLYAGNLGVGALDAYGALTFDVGPILGKLVKLEDSNAVYYLSGNARHLFSNENVFWSWYGGTWSDHPVEIISQGEFDSLLAGKNVTVRPGSNLIKFQNSNRLYAVAFNNTIHYVPNEVIEWLYGEDYQDRVALIQNSFESDYRRGDKLDGGTYPDGSVVRYKESEDLWLIQNGDKRKFKDGSFVANGFDEKYVIDGIRNSYSFTLGRAIEQLEKIIYQYLK